MTIRSSSKPLPEILNPDASATSNEEITTIQDGQTKIENEFQLAEEDNDITQRWKPGSQEILALVVSAVMAMILAFDAIMMIGILPYFSTALDGNTLYTAWPQIAFLIAGSVTHSFFAAVAEVVGSRCVLFAAVISYTTGAVICSNALVYLMLIIGRCTQGFGAGGMIAIMLVIVKDIVPSRPRPIYAGIIFGSGSIGAALGPIIGSVVLERTTWNTLFYIMIPLSGLLLLAIPWLRIPNEELAEGRQFLSIDWTGGAIFTGGLSSLLLGISWGGELYPWNSWRVILIVAAGGFGVLAALVYERGCASRPFIPFRILMLAPTAFICIFLNGMMMFCQIYSMQLYFKATKLLSPIDVAANLLPITLMVLPTAALVGIITNYYASFRWAAWSGSTITLLSSGFMMVLGVDSSPSTWIAILLVAGLGHGLSLSALHSSVQATVPNSADIRLATSLDGLLRTLGLTIGVSVGDVVFRARLRYHLANGDRKIKQNIIEAAMSFLTGPLTASMPHRDLPIVRRAYAESFRNIAQMLTVLAAVGFVASLFIGRRGFAAR